MKWIVSAVVLGLALAATCASDEFTRVCDAGATWNDGCNECRCTDTGFRLCTQRACIGTPQLQRECEEGTVWQEDCNTCRCVSGRTACTYKRCLPQQGPPQQGQHDPNDCTPGTLWKQDCNTCRCTATGRAVCTQMACLNAFLGDAFLTKTKRSVKPIRVGDECEPGTSWKQDCNSCTCSSTGYAMCTYKLCLPQQQQQQLQQPRLRRDVAAAVVANAEPGAPVAEVGERRCAQGEVWKEACNTCRCTPDGLPACTKMRCIARPKQDRAISPPAAAAEEVSVEDASATATTPGFFCRPGSTWKKGCNTCKCSWLLPVCTLMACSEE